MTRAVTSTVPAVRQRYERAFPAAATVRALPRRIVPTGALLPSDSPRRQRENAAHVRMLAESGAEFAPILVHRPSMRVIDGMHRLRATVQRGRNEIAVRYFDGSEADAFVLSVELNARNGLPLTLAERKTAAGRIVDSHPHWSDRAIAERTGLSAKTVGKIRRRVSVNAPPGPHTSARVGRDGRVRPLNSAESRRRAAVLLGDRPHASLREIAKETDLSPATVRDVRNRLERGEDPVPGHLRAAAPPEPAPLVPPARRQVTGPRRPARGNHGRQARSAVQKLIRDPSLRATECGRLLLRMLLTTEMEPAQLQRIATNVPAHCAPLVHALAMKRVQEWHELADLLSQRSKGAA